MKPELPNFKVLTRKSVLDIEYKNETQHERDCSELVKEQNEILEKKGFKFNKSYKVHFYDSHYTNDFTTDMDLEYAIQCLAIKDGCDLVKYDNGLYGYVAYYNGYKNGFEILESESD